MNVVFGFLAGLLFGVGLVVAGMSDPAKVLAFLDIFGARSGNWDPSLAFVMGGASVTAFLGYRLVWRRAQPVLFDAFDLPSARAIDAPLLTGAAIFGVGWGIGGFCPGPAWTALTASAPALPPGVLAFVPAMLAGLALGRWAKRRAATPVTA